MSCLLIIIVERLFINHVLIQISQIAYLNLKVLYGVFNGGVYGWCVLSHDSSLCICNFVFSKTCMGFHIITFFAYYINIYIIAITA